MTIADKYIYQVYIKQSFVKAAKALFVSQPSLSATIAHKEKELGFQIFDRTAKPVALTPQGHIYIDILQEMKELEDKMQLRLDELNCNKQKTLCIGGSASFSYYLIPLICGSFHRRYPNVDVTIDAGNFSASALLTEKYTLFQKLDKGDMDALFCYDYDTQKFTGHHICTERLVVAMHRDLVHPSLQKYAITRDELLNNTYDPKKEIHEKNVFKDVPFLTFSRTSALGHYMDELLGEYRPCSCRVVNSVHSIVHFNMMRAGICALLTGDTFIALSDIDSDTILYFVYPRDVSTRSIYLITKKGISENKSLQNYISIAQELYNSESSFPPYTIEES